MNRKCLWNDNWYFSKTAPDVKWEEREKWETVMEQVDLPHDWLIYNTLDLYEGSIGWYRKEFVMESMNESVERGQRTILRFEGVYMDSTVYVNGREVGQWKYGYSTFDWDITEYLQPGKNEVVVKVVHLAPNSRWYSGAGIYRNVWFISMSEVHIPLDGIYVSTVEKENGYDLLVDTEIEWGRQYAEQVVLEYCLFYKESLLFRERKPLACGQKRDSRTFFVENPKKWDITEPNLYRLEVKLFECGKQEAEEAEVKAVYTGEAKNSTGDEENVVQKKEMCTQTESVNVGFRTIAYLPDQGFLLNGRKVRMNGACDHHDLGALGAAFNKAAMRRKFLMMRSMGVNAIRTSHNMPAVELMELADEMGFLVVSEAFDMWEISKTEYDYGRFFKEWADKDVRSWIRRDRNHPSVIMWSIGNEIPDTHVDAHGQEITYRLMDYVKQWDYRSNAPITIGSNYMPWQNAQKCADIVKMAGYNYAEKYYAEHHEKYPDWIIYGSETSSVVQSRGVYHFPLERATLIEEDEQCSALGNSTTSWAAKNAEYCITMDRNTEYSCGQFIWTAFDYIGEPTPYQTKNSYFGQIDTAGFPKDAFYLYQAEWTDYKTNPMVHVYPYWDFNPGQVVDVRICSNAPEVELFVNGESQGRRKIDHVQGTVLQPHWKVVYVPGSIKAVAYDENGKRIAEEERHSFGDTAGLVLKTDKSVMNADGQDMIFVEISAVDKEGYPVENAADYVKVSVTGAGRLVGLDNGDSTDYDQYKGTVRKLFQGKLLAMVAAKTEPGEICVKVEPVQGSCDVEECNSESCKKVQENELLSKQRDCGVIANAELRLQAIEAPALPGICARTENTYMPLAEVKYGYVPVRKVELTAPKGQCIRPVEKEPGVQGRVGDTLTKENPYVTMHAKIYPSDATDTNVIWKLVDASGMECRIAKLEVMPDGESAKVIGLGDGSFYVRCMSKNGTDKVKLISQLDMCVEGMGEAFVSPYAPVVGATYASAKGDVGRGPRDSAGTDKDTDTQLTYKGLDFGDYGSDEVTLSIFANDSAAHSLQIWQGIPGEEGSELLGDVIYQKPGEWEVFKPETYRLDKRVSGVNTITIVAHDKLFLKDFVFTRQEKAFAKLAVAETAVIYGDSYELTKKAVEHIGNNVSLAYEDMDFGEQGTSSITICGRTPLPTNTIQLRFSGETESVQVLEFPHSEEYICKKFELQKVTGKVSVNFVFLPGCNFDFEWFGFES